MMFCESTDKDLKHFGETFLQNTNFPLSTTLAQA